MHDPAHSPLKDLERAPLLAPPETLWPKLRDGQRKAVARRRVLLGASATALAGVFALAAILPWATPPQVESPRPVAADPEVLEQIATLDRALQAAYESDASDDDVAPMWAARADLLNQLPATALN